MEKGLQKLLNLAKKTGDRLIIHDSAKGQSMVVMQVEDYEHLMLGDIAEDNFETASFVREPSDLLDRWDEIPDIVPAAPYPDSASIPDVPVEDNWSSAADVLEDRYGSAEEIEWDEEPQSAESQMSDGANQSVETPPLSIEEIPFDAPMPPAAEDEWHEEPLDEEPVFLEEPV